MRKLRSRLLLCFLFSSIMCWAIPMSPAFSDVSCIGSDFRGRCDISITLPGRPGAPRKPASRGQGNPAGGPCVRDGVEVPCVTDYGVYDATLKCYLQEANPQPDRSAPIWAGRTGGKVYTCSYYSYFGTNLWVPDAPAPPPDPEVLARRAVDEMGVRGIDMGVFPHLLEELPSGNGFVGWNVWLWVRDPSEVTWGPVSRTVSEGGYSVTATAVVSEVAWDMGDGGVVRCGKGTAWQSFQVRNEKSPSCGYVYEKTGEFTITATSHWVVNWSGVGESGVIEFDVNSQGHVDVVEVNVLNIPNRKR